LMAWWSFRLHDERETVLSDPAPIIEQKPSDEMENKAPAIEPVKVQLAQVVVDSKPVEKTNLVEDLASSQPTSSSNTRMFENVAATTREPSPFESEATSVDAIVGSWVEPRPDTPVGDRVRTFQADGTLIVATPKSGIKLTGTWRRDGKRIYFSHPDGNGALIKDKWFEIVKIDGRLMVISMEGQRSYEWSRNSPSNKSNSDVSPIIGSWKTTDGTESKRFSEDGTLVEMHSTGKVFNSGQWQVGDNALIYCKLKNNFSTTIEMAGTSKASFTVFDANGRFVEKKQMVKDD